VVQILKAIVARRIMPYFRKSKGSDPIAVARVSDHLTIERLEDEENRVRVVSLVTQQNQDWFVHIHERIFDYLAFVIPTNPESRLGEATHDERKILAFAEFMLRHEIEHILYPQHSEREVLQSDAGFAMERRSDDPTFYRALRNALADEMTGLKGQPHLALFDRAEKGQTYGTTINEILNPFVAILADLPEKLIRKVFPLLDTELKTKVLGLCYKRSRDTNYSLLRRTASLQRVLRLFDLLMDLDKDQAQSVFDGFKDNWGLIYLLQELGLHDISVEGKSAKEIFELFKRVLRQFSEELDGVVPSVPPQPASAAESKTPAPAVKSLKDRIEEAGKDPRIPVQVMEAIEKNKLNAVGHSGSKYSELIETLLAIPWGKIQRIDVTPEAFEEGLDRSHYGLRKPKETICDFFTNLIWRYQQFNEENVASWRRNGSAFLLVGPPGVGKTSLAISIAQNLKIPYHKLSLGGMRDEADLRGHGFTYEGSKPGAIVQGIIKMGTMNGMFIMDEADKTEKFAIATLLEILDPEQNHLFHDKYTETTVDIDLSNCHFMLTANTLETVPPPVVNRCEVIFLDRYSVEEKVSIARQHLIQRVRQQYQITEEQILVDPAQETDLLRHLIKTYTHEAGVRELERLIRTLFLRIFRKEILPGLKQKVLITRNEIREYLEPPRGPRQINDDDRIGEMMSLGVNVELGIGSLIPIQATSVHAGGGGEPGPAYLSMVHATGNIQRIMDESRKVATTAIFHCAEPMKIDLDRAGEPIHLHFMGGSTSKDGPSAGGAIALALASILSGRRIRRDVAMTGEIDTHGRITVIGALDVKLETAYDAGCRTVIIPKENLHGEAGVDRLSDAIKRELQVLSYEAWKEDHPPFDHERHVLQVVGVDHILQAADIAFIEEDELKELESRFVPHARSVAEALAQARKSPNLCFPVLYVKDLAELELENLEASFWEECGGVLLVRPEARESVLAKYPRIEEHTRLVSFDPAHEDLAEVLKKVEKQCQSGLSGPVRLSVLAPFFFLVEQRASLERFAHSSALRTLTLFSNNYTLQGVKIKASKPVLNRVCHHLSHLEPEQLETCPFLGKRDGIYVMDLSYIPEKYSLDVERASRILNAGLKKWLMTIEEFESRGAVQDNPPPQSPRKKKYRSSRK
jgi:ATP-dependent Lon protease